MLCLFFLLLPSLALGHSYLGLPASRNLEAHLEGAEDCPHCLQSGGPDNVKARGNSVWPSRLAPGSHGLCGDPVQGEANPARLADETYLRPGPVVETYQPGQIAEFHVVVSTHHQGHYEFRICDRALDGRNLESAAQGQMCLDQWLLERAPPPEDCVANDPRGDCQPLDPKHPERWYLPPAGGQTQTAGASFTDAQAPSYPTSTEVHIMRYKIPEDLSCSACTLQWYWSSGNSCLYDGDYFDYFKGLDALGWDVSAWQPNILASWANCDNSCCNSEQFGEEFWNCADIAVLQGGTQPTPSPSPSPSPVATTTSTTTSIMSALAWEPVDGGESRACRGASPTDNSASHYTAFSGVETLDFCKAKCMGTAGCKGIEYNSGGRCEVWTRAGGILASSAVNGFTCLRYGTLPTTTLPDMEPFVPVDGGENRACRGANRGDNAASYFDVHYGVATMQDCKIRCAVTAGCKGIEYKSGGRRCEIWTRPEGIQASAPFTGYTCLRYGELPTTSMPNMGSFEAVDGAEGRACRGANSNDNSNSYFTVHFGVTTLNDCKIRCASASECKGIEYKSSGRCEIWTRSEGIQATKSVAGYECYRYSAASPTTSVASTTMGAGSSACAKVWQKCGGDDWDGPTCCEQGSTCVRETQWYSQCVPPSLLQRDGPAHKGKSRRHNFLGTALLQDGALLEQGAGRDFDPEDEL